MISHIYNGNIKFSMFKFVLDPAALPTNLPSINVQLYRNIYIDKIQQIGSVEIPKNSYIMPSGIYGQIYYYLIKDKENIVGFLDNNAQRHGKLLYGTNKMVYLPSSIDYNTATIIICDCPYKDEIISGLKQLCASIRILYI